MLTDRRDPRSTKAATNKHSGGYAKEDFDGDVKQVVDLLKQGELSREDADLILSAYLGLFAASEINSMVDEYSDELEQMLIDAVSGAKRS